MKYINQIKELEPLLQGTNHIDIKTVEGNLSHEEFIASLLSFPKWAQFFFQIRKFVARVLGLKHEKKAMSVLESHNIPMNIGDTALFFTVRMVKKEHYWIVESLKDKHLRAYLGILVEPLNKEIKRFYVITIVHYKHWTGLIYFNLIRPFHHLLVYILTKSAVKNKK